MPDQTRVLVTGAGGFIGHHLVNYLVSRGYRAFGLYRQLSSLYRQLSSKENFRLN